MTGSRTGNTSNARRGYFALPAVLAAVISLLFLLTWGILALNSGVRAYVNGESLWSKARSDSVTSLLSYLETGRESALDRFHERIAVPLGDRRAHRALDSESFDRAAAVSGFRAGGNHPDDIPIMILIYRWLHWAPHFEEAIDTWRQADRRILELRDLGERAAALVPSAGVGSPEVERLADRVRALDARLRPLEIRFSEAMGAAARSFSRTLFWVLLGASLVLLALGAYLLRRLMRRVYLAEAHFRATFSQAGVGMANTDLDGNWTELNNSLARMLGATPEALIGRRFTDFTHPEDLERSRAAVRNLLEGNAERERLEKRYVGVNGEVVWANVTVTLRRDMQGRPRNFIVVIEDITERKRLADQLAWQARHDGLTGLINRHEFERRLEQAVDRAQTDGSPCALLYLDLDQFKIVNDSCGHMAGDDLLRQLGPLIRSCLRSSDTVARLGGDEFGIILEGCSLNAAIAVAEKLRAAIADFRFAWEDRSFGLAASIGLVTLDGRTARDDRKLTAMELLSAADAACYSAKDVGRNNVYIAEADDPDLDRRRRELGWLERLQHALDREQLFLMRQAILPLSGADDRRHFEVLLRMEDDAGSVHEPGRFLQAAERFGIVSDLDIWVLRRVLDWMQDNRHVLPDLATVSLNLSGVSLGRPGFLSEARRLVESAPVPADRLCFEITESAAIGNIGAALEFMQDLRRLGCRFALDDFGRGVSSFAYLNSLPVAYVKIDGVFVRDMHREPVHEAMVRSISEVARSMGKQTIAEFVEDRVVMDMLVELGVDFAQGFHVGRPEPLVDEPPPAQVARAGGS